MTAPQARRPQGVPRPACTPAAIRAVLAASAGAEVLQRYDQDLDAAFEQAREDGDLTPDAQRQFLARVGQYLGDGPPHPQERMSRQEIRAQYGV